MATEPSITLPLAVALPVPGMLPRNWERAFGYRGCSRWLAVWWEPAGDEAAFDDGQLRTDGEWQFYLDLVESRLESAPATLLADDPRGRWALGSSDEPATHCLMLDLQERRIFVAPLADARLFLRRQHALRKPCNQNCASRCLPRFWRRSCGTLPTSSCRKVMPYHALAPIESVRLIASMAGCLPQMADTNRARSVAANGSSRLSRSRVRPSDMQQGEDQLCSLAT